MSDITDVEDQRAEGLKAWGWVSYLLHLIVAVGAVIPGAQPGAALLIIALVIDLVKKSDSDGTWQAAAWKLERRHPQDYGRTITEHQGNDDAPIAIRLIRRGN